MKSMMTLLENGTLVLHWIVYSAIKTDRCRYLKMILLTRCRHDLLCYKVLVVTRLSCDLKNYFRLLSLTIIKSHYCLKCFRTQFQQERNDKFNWKRCQFLFVALNSKILIKYLNIFRFDPTVNQVLRQLYTLGELRHLSGSSLIS